MKANLLLCWFAAITTVLSVARSDAAVIVTDPDGDIQTVAGFPTTFFDLDGNGVDDLGLWNDGLAIWADGTDSNQILGTPLFLGYNGTALPSGAFIGADPPVGSEWILGDASLNTCSGGSCLGQFVGGINYLAVEFDISGATHYGWLEIESSPFFNRASVRRWAYETEPGVGIIAGIPEPGSGSLVILGLVFGLLRRRR